MTRARWAGLSTLEDGDYARLDTLAEDVRFRAGDRLVEQNKPLEVLLLVLEGRVSVRREYRGAHIDVTVLGPGELVGEISFVTGDPASASVVAVDEVRCARIRRGALGDLLKQDAAFASRFYASLALLMARRLRATTAQLPLLDTPHRERRKARPPKVEEPRVQPPGFLVDAVENFKTGIRDLERTIEERGPTEDDQPRASQLVAELKKALARAVQELQKSGAPPQAAGELVFRETFPFFMLSSLIDRIFTKPKGKPIDTLALEHIYRGRASGRGYLGRLIDRDFLNSPPCRTLKERRKEIARTLRRVYEKDDPNSETFGVTSLMSGPGFEFYDFVDSIAARRKLRATLFDADVEALSLGDHLARERRIRHQLVLAQVDARNLVTGKRETHVPSQDVVYSSGILDVLDDDDEVVSLLEWIFDHLSPGGTCLLCSFGSSNPDKAFMRHILDWDVAHRSVDDLVRLFSASRFGSEQLKVRVHASGASLIATSRRPD